MRDNVIPKIAVVVGTRPNFVKVAPFIHQNKKQSLFDLRIIHTGQHFDDNMSEVFFNELDIPKPDINLKIGKIASTNKNSLMLGEMKKVLSENNFSAVVVFGDVDSTLAGGMAAYEAGIPLVHIESGLRSFDTRMPEETNRVKVDHMSDFLFVTEYSGIKNLKEEGIEGSKIYLVGNIMIESLEIFRGKIDKSHALEYLDLKPKNYIVVTIHRKENTNDHNNLEKILRLLNQLSSRYKVVFPLHPGTKNKIEEFGLDQYLEGINIIDPISYFGFVKLTKESGGVVTDSGGIQEETSHLGVSCCTLRDNTERPITLELGSNKLFDINEAKSADLLDHLTRDFKPGRIPLWDALVSQRIFKVLGDQIR